MKFIKDLNWRTAFKRAAVFTAIWLALVYFLSNAFPGSFELGSGRDLLPLAINAVFFFFLYAVLAALLERQRARRMGKTEANKERPGKGAQDSERDDEEPAGSLKGRYNPNTSRRKARRKRQSLRRQ